MNNTWAVILAGGDGTRLQSMTRAITGDDRPKQFVPVIGGTTLLDQTRRRVALSIERERTLIVVTRKHRRFYKPLAKEISPNLLVEQPHNKGTAPAIVYALLRIAAKSPQAIVAMFPSDHFFADDEEFMSHIDAAVTAVRAQPEAVTLLGITPTAPETEYGWIEPQPSILSHAEKSITRVSKFWEKAGVEFGNYAHGTRLFVEQLCNGWSFRRVAEDDARRVTGNVFCVFNNRAAVRNRFRV